MPDSPALRLDDVSVSRGGNLIWSDGDFAIPSGQFTAIIGPNGSGKSTLLLMMLGLLPASSGRVSVLGSTPRRGNSDIGYVPQTYVTDGGTLMRARDLVMLGLNGGRLGLGRASDADNRKVDEALASVGAAEFAGRRMSELSGGQQQRVAIAQAIVSEPQILALDEPLANLDVRNQHEIVALLQHIQQGRDMSIFVVVHDLNPLLSVMDGAIYLLDTHAHYAPVGEVVSAELLTHLYGTDMRVVRTPQGDLFTRSG